MAAHQTRNQSEKHDVRLTPEAKETWADQQCFNLDAAQWSVFLEALDRPAREHPRLENLLRQSGIFDKSDVT